MRHVFQRTTEIAEGEITYTEAVAAVRAMKSNKKPESGGYTSEVYNFFFRNIGIFLVRSINNGFRNMQLVGWCFRPSQPLRVTTGLIEIISNAKTRDRYMYS